MKKVTLIFIMILGAVSANAQIKIPKMSPRAYVTQMVGFTEVDLEYSRPSVKGRIIFGDLVPFGKIWRTGANENTIITFSEDVTIGGKPLKKGKYGLYTLPKADIWEVYFYATTNNWGTPDQWDESKIVLKTTAKPEMLSRSVENFTLGLNSMDANSAVLELTWERTYLPVRIDFSTQAEALKTIDKTLAGPDTLDYYNAATYYYNSNLDMVKALAYINKALDLSADKPFYETRLKSLIQYKLGDKKGAIDTAKISLAAAEIAKDAEYIKLNKESINEWSKK